MIIGNFHYDAEHDIYSGEIATLTLERSKIALRPNDKSSDKEPDYRVVQEREEGAVELGAAWKRRSENRRDFLSIALDDPSLPTPLNAVMSIVTDGEPTRLVWQRAPKKAPEPKPQSPRARRAQTAGSPQPTP